MPGWVDVWKSSPALAVPSAAHPARHCTGHSRRLGRQPECSCHRYLAMGARLQVPGYRRLGTQPCLLGQLCLLGMGRYEQTGGLFRAGRRLKQSYRRHSIRRPIRPVISRFLVLPWVLQGF
jgi:hypothetical protein